MTATVKAASNGSTDTTPAPERKSGLALVREAEVYHTASIAQDAAFEAERLCSDICRTAGAYLQRDNVSEAAQALTHPEMQRKLREAVECLNTAQDYLRHLMVADEPPF
jgi:hypothetical protein